MVVMAHWAKSWPGGLKISTPGQPFCKLRTALVYLGYFAAPSHESRAIKWIS